MKKRFSVVTLSLLSLSFFLSALSYVQLDGPVQYPDNQYASSLIQTHLQEYRQNCAEDDPLYPEAYAGSYFSDENHYWLRLTDADDPDSLALRELALENGIPVHPSEYSYNRLYRVYYQIERARGESPISQCSIDLRDNTVVVRSSDPSDALRGLTFRDFAPFPGLRFAQAVSDDPGDELVVDERLEDEIAAQKPSWGALSSFLLENGGARYPDNQCAYSLIQTHLQEYQKNRGEDDPLYPEAYAGFYYSDENHYWLRLTDADDPDSLALRELALENGIPIHPSEYSNNKLSAVVAEVEENRRTASVSLPITDCYIDSRFNQVVVCISGLNDIFREIFWREMSDFPGIRLIPHTIDEAPVEYLDQTESGPSKGTLSGTVNIGPVAVRKRPVSGSEPLGVLKKGESVTLLNIERSWFLIEYQGKKGYVYAQYIDVLP